MAIPNHILVHTALPVTYQEDGQAPMWIEGEPGQTGVVPTRGAPFVCVLFLPSPGGSADTPYRPRVVRTPTLLYNPTRTAARAAQLAGQVPAVPADGSPIVVTSETDLLVYAPELAAWTGGAFARWQSSGDAQPFGPPGSVVGVLSQLRQVQD